MTDDTQPTPDALNSGPEDAVYDRMAGAARAGCCDQRRKPCVEHAMFIDGVEMALMAPEAMEWRRKAEVYDRIAEIVGNHRWLQQMMPTGYAENDCDAAGFRHVAALFPEAD